MYMHKHPLAYQATQEEKFVWHFSLKQLAWLAVGLYLSSKLAGLVPPLPLESQVLRHLHHALPLVVCVLFAWTREPKTGLPLYTYLIYWVLFKQRQKILTYKRGTGLN